MSETDELRASLRHQRAHVTGILDGLDEPVLRRAVLPSGWTCLGLVRHLTLDVERFWFGAVIAGAPARDTPGRAWAVPPGLSAGEVLEEYRRECDRADVVLDTARPDDSPGWWPAGRFGTWRLGTVRAVALHVIAETAGHAGHLDAVCELIDGRQWMVPENVDAVAGTGGK